MPFVDRCSKRKTDRGSLFNDMEKAEILASRSQESQDGFYPCTHAMDFGMTESILAFSVDEKKFSLDGADTFTSYWRDLTKERRSFSTRNFGCGSLMEWAAFSSFGALELVLISTKTNSVGYKQVLENHLLPYYNRFPQKNFIFQQDNAAIHVSCSTKDWFRRRNIVLTDWPSRSPDRNPSENLWGILASQVYAHNRQLSSIEGLKKTVSEEWSKIDPTILKNLSTSMTERTFQMISGRGSCTDY
uniref:DDE_3 domain-containing protein n=1 Tax=Heterorhabditis bacteriophora TaxID=37862 RepID=A0A1I7XHA1_HETBA